MTEYSFGALFRLIGVAMSMLAFSSHTFAQVIDPEAQIRKNGYHTVNLGDDGVTRFYTFTERATASRISALEQSVAGLPKQTEVYKFCDQMRGSVKANLIRERGQPFDVVATNYGYSGSTIACVLKYMHENSVGTQLLFMKKAAGGMYMVFVTD